jgi:hypothetical protein
MKSFAIVLVNFLFGGSLQAFAGYSREAQGKASFMRPSKLTICLECGRQFWDLG